jgi:hypothetical protein
MSLGLFRSFVPEFAEDAFVVVVEVDLFGVVYWP